MRTLALGVALAGAVLIVAVPTAPRSEDAKPVGMTAQQLDALCRHYDSSCASFMDATYAWMRAHSESVGRLCDPCQEAVCTRGTQRMALTGGDQLGSAFTSWAGSQSWFKTASAHDAAIATIQAQMSCGPGYFVPPGDSRFPSPPQNRPVR
jgi:hypothetical protein